mmetsp:Transcript_67104/g.145952  ORF Transcript_67104/g.145952 Transcript_67104/m.145952 type:complete len:87 (-) Transcript_67104:185-445(-)
MSHCNCWVCLTHWHMFARDALQIEAPLQSLASTSSDAFKRARRERRRKGRNTCTAKSEDAAEHKDGVVTVNQPSASSKYQCQQRET